MYQPNLHDQGTSKPELFIQHAPKQTTDVSSHNLGQSPMNLGLATDFLLPFLAQNERISGYPRPELYNQYYINKFSYPKGFKAVRKRRESEQPIPGAGTVETGKSFYDIEAPSTRKGFTGWKLTLGMNGARRDDPSGSGDLLKSVLPPVKKYKRHLRNNSTLVVGHQLGSHFNVMASPRRMVEETGLPPGSLQNTSADMLDSAERARRATEEQRLLNIYIDSPMDQYQAQKTGSQQPVSRVNEQECSNEVDEKQKLKQDQ